MFNTVSRVVVGSSCDYFASVEYPDDLEGGLRVAKIGNSSVTYQVGIFKKGESNAAAGDFTHVFVTREDQRPTPIPAEIRGSLETLLVSGQ